MADPGLRYHRTTPPLKPNASIPASDSMLRFHCNSIKPTLRPSAHLCPLSSPHIHVPLLTPTLLRALFQRKKISPYHHGQPWAYGRQRQTSPLAPSLPRPFPSPLKSRRACYPLAQDPLSPTPASHQQSLKVSQDQVPSEVSLPQGGLSCFPTIACSTPSLRSTHFACAQ